MICNQTPSTAAPWQSYTSMVASIKPEPQSYGQYGGSYPEAGSPYSSTGSPYTPTSPYTVPAADDQLDNDLQDIKLEELDNLDNEINELVMNDARSLEQMRSSVSPQSRCSSDLECGGSPAPSTDCWYDQRVPSAGSPYTRDTDSAGLYTQDNTTPTAIKQQPLPPVPQMQHYQSQQQQQQQHTAYTHPALHHFNSAAASSSR